MATFLEQSIEYQKKQVATLTAQQAEYDAAANALSSQYAAARRALRDAQANPATPPAQLAQLQANFDSISNSYFTARDKASSNQELLTRTEEALNSNLLKVNDPNQNVSFATPAGNVNTGGTTTATSTGTDPQVNQTTQIQNNTRSGTVPPGDPAEGTDPTGVYSEDGTKATGIAINPETGDTYYPPVDEPPDTLEEPPIEDTEFGDLDAAIAEQEGTGLQEPPMLSDEEVDDYLNDVGRGPDEEPEAENPSTSQGLTGPKKNAQAQATLQDEANFQQKEDWRVRLSLAPESNYLYNLPGNQGILAPLVSTDGVIFPYTPSISVNYAANYDPVDVIHSNYKFFQYKNSSVDSITITCDFTAQDTFEANYLLAVIHFFRCVTKMWYGQDESPKPGTPPPLCYLSGLGSFQFDAHPLAVTQFNYSLPTDVDYIRAGTTTTNAGVNKSPEKNVVNSNVPSNGRDTGLGPGGTVPPPRFTNVPGGTIEPTYVPTKMQISISAVPILSRNDVSNRFSLRDYGTGKLLQGSKNKRAGIW